MEENKPFEPFVPASRVIPEVTPQAIILGVVLGIVLASANAYLGLYAGMTVGASIPAAVISMAILRGLLKRGTILENNMVQTMASTGESLAAGIIFTVPAMLITGVWTEIQFFPTMLICLTGGLLGILFMIPLRRSHIIEDKDLVYPEGQACFEVLKAGETGESSAKPLFLGGLFGGLFKFCIAGAGLFVGSVEKAWTAGKAVLFMGTDISVALLGTGYLVGFNVGTLVFLGGCIGWVFALPYYSMTLGLTEAANADALDIAWTVWSTKIRYLGVGAMITGGIWSLIKMRNSIFTGLVEAFGGYKAQGKRQKEVPRTDRNMDNKHILLLLVVTLITIFGLYMHLTNNFGITLVATICMFIMSFLFVAVASYICGLVGSSNSPVSGMTICALLFTGGLIYLLGMSGSQAIIATLGVAGVVCCAACTSGDIAQDLKTGYLCGATPKNQQLMEIIGTIGPALFITPILIILHQAYGIGTDAPGSLKAPQAGLFASLVLGFFGKGQIPWDVVAYGAAIGIFFGILDLIQEQRKASFRFPIMAIAIGIYLPITLNTPIFVGGLIRKFFKSAEGGSGTLAAAGLIAGESLMGVGVALAVFFGQKMGFSLPFQIWPEGMHWAAELASLVALGAAIGFLIRWVRQP